LEIIVKTLKILITAILITSTAAAYDTIPLLCGPRCRKIIQEQDQLIWRFKEHDPAAIGLSDITQTGRRVETYELQRIWEALGIPKDRQHPMARAWYAPTYADLIKFLEYSTAHLKIAREDYHCSDYADDLLGERLAMGIWGTCESQWYMATLGVIHGQYRTRATSDNPAGMISHTWNWAYCADKKLYFIDYMIPAEGVKYDTAHQGITFIYEYDPELSGPITNGTVFW
jgi:hypothetical protein